MSDIESDDGEVLHIRKRRNVLRISSDESKSSDNSESEEDFSSASEFEDDLCSDSGSEEDENKSFGWVTQNDFRAPFDFYGNPGQQFDVPHTSKSKCLFYLDKYLDNELLCIIVEQTNLYAAQYIQGMHLKKRSRMRNWYPTNNIEMKCFIAFLLLQGIVRKPTLQMYFSNKEIISTPFFKKVMSRDRFLLLCKFLHFENNSNVTSTSKLSKIENVLKIIKNKCKTFYIPNQDICIDECLVLWKGRLSWKQYIPSKRNRFGMKFYVLCESESGYIWNFCVYTGKNTDYGQNYPEYKTAARIVLELSHDLLHQGYRVYVDNWYTSIELANKLCTCKTDIVGTIQQRRLGIPSSIKTTTLKRGESMAIYNNKIMLLK